MAAVSGAKGRLTIQIMDYETTGKMKSDRPQVVSPSTIMHLAGVNRGVNAKGSIIFTRDGSPKRWAPWTNCRGSPTGAVEGLTADTLFAQIQGSDLNVASADKSKILKVTIAGAGNVGMACAQTILTHNLVDELALVDSRHDKVRGEMLDLQHAAAFLPTANIMSSNEYSITANSDICIIAAGSRQGDGESRLSLVDRNVSILKSIVPELVKYSPDSILMVVSNPVDILSWVVWKLSGFPPNRVIGSGTNLDSSRFRFLIASHLGVNAQNVHAHILGEHGDSSVPLWSSINVGGIPVSSFLENQGLQADPEVLKEAHKEVVNGAYDIIKLKGYTSWAIGYSVTNLVGSVLRNRKRIHPTSVLAKGFHGITDEVFLSLPAQLGRSGVVGITNSVLTEDETRQLQESAKAIWDIQSKLKNL